MMMHWQHSSVVRRAADRRPIAPLCTALALVCSAALAQGLVAQDGGFVWQQGDEVIRFKDGVWSAGLSEGPSVRFLVFLWHDASIYETLQAGPREVEAQLQPDGSVTYTDRPPAAGSGRIITLGRNAAAAEPEAVFPLELRQPTQRYPVTVYTSSDCAPCDSGRRLLQHATSATLALDQLAAFDFDR